MQNEHKEKLQELQTTLLAKNQEIFTLRVQNTIQHHVIEQFQQEKGKQILEILDLNIQISSLTSQLNDYEQINKERSSNILELENKHLSQEIQRLSQENKKIRAELELPIRDIE